MMGIYYSISSIGYGANIIEFHITRSVELIGTDHRASRSKRFELFSYGCDKHKIEGQPNPEPHLKKKYLIDLLLEKVLH